MYAQREPLLQPPLQQVAQAQQRTEIDSTLLNLAERLQKVKQKIDEKLVDRTAQHGQVEGIVMKEGRYIKLEPLKWFCPALLAFIGYALQSIGLHYATYQYVHKWAMIDHPAEEGFPPVPKLPDVEDMLPGHGFTLAWIDAIAAAFPGMFVFVCVCQIVYNFCQHVKKQSPERRRVARLRSRVVLQIWTKVMICAAHLFFFKGVIGAVTTVPDSSGWEVCRARLGDEGVKWMREEHSFWDLVRLDWWWVPEHHGLLRYCSDMVYSGHTFTVTLFALGLYELVPVFIDPFDKMTKGSPKSEFKEFTFNKRRAWCKAIILTSLSTLTIAEQAIEIYVVLKTRFHYTMDIILALLLTFLFYTNGVIAIAAKRWVSVEGYQCGDQSRKYAYHMRDDYPELFGPHAASLMSRGDIYVPWCCIPCCCLAGREHIYSDSLLRDLLQKQRGLTPEQREDLAFAMAMELGFNVFDVVMLCAPQKEAEKYSSSRAGNWFTRSASDKNRK